MKFIRILIPILFLSLGLAACARTTATEIVEAQPAAEQAASQAPTNTPAPLVEVEPTATEPPAPTSTPGPTATPTEIVPYVQTVGSFLAIPEIGLGPQGYVSLYNFTSVPVTTQGLYLCQGSDCFALPEAVIDAGTTGRVAVGDGKGLEGVIATHATIGELKPSDGEAALFASDKFDDPKAMLVYIQWGSTPHALTDLAVQAGLWIRTGYAPTTANATRLYRVEESGWWLFEEAKP